MPKYIKKVLILVAHRPGRSPSQRFRYEQYLLFLESKGYQFEQSFLISEEDDVFFYKQGFYFSKFKVLVKSFFRRWRDTSRVRSFDAVFIQREAFMLGTSFFERRIAKTGVPIIFDYDDAIWRSNREGGNKTLSFLKNPDKISEIISVSSFVIAGNQYLADYASKYCDNVSIIPTTIDTEYHKSTASHSEIVIGWTGTFSTFPYLKELFPVLRKIKASFPQVKFNVICDLDTVIPELGIRTTLWNKEDEIIQLQSISIGVMPLPDNDWSKGKCGFKGLQYMSLKIPTLMSPVGVNVDILRDGENGFLPDSPEQWYNRLTQLIQDKSLRIEMGEKGYQSVISNYSVNANKWKYLELFEKATMHANNTDKASH